jgi:sec-independent protein translocase protein TatA
MIADLLRPGHMLILFIVFVLVFGVKRLPELAKAIGKSIHTLKNEVRTLGEDDDKQHTQAQKKKED